MQHGRKVKVGSCPRGQLTGRDRLAYPHTTPDATVQPTLGNPAILAQVVAPLQSVNQSVGQDDLALDVQLMFGAEQRMGRRFHGDCHVERVLHHQSSVVQV